LFGKSLALKRVWWHSVGGGSCCIQQGVPVRGLGVEAADLFRRMVASFARAILAVTHGGVVLSRIAG
jgi:hypothetical protein